MLHAFFKALGQFMSKWPFSIVPPLGGKGEKVKNAAVLKPDHRGHSPRPARFDFHTNFSDFVSCFKAKSWCISQPRFICDFTPTQSSLQQKYSKLCLVIQGQAARDQKGKLHFNYNDQNWCAVTSHQCLETVSVPDNNNLHCVDEPT